jgi:dTDP-4-dehydrorhamnose reductase
MDRKGKKRILITGISGFLGWNLGRLLSSDFYVTGTCLTHSEGLPSCSAFPMNITDLRNIRQSLRKQPFDVILHTAAMTRPDVCDQKREDAFRINVEGTANLSEVAREWGALLIHISTDLVFDGSEGGYGEEDPPNPVNYYGETKLEAEQKVRSLCSEWLILRTALMYGWGNSVSRSFVDWLDGSLREGKQAPLFTDQIRTFLYVRDVADAVRFLLRKNVKNELFHLGGAEDLSRYDFGELFIEIFEYPLHLLRPVSMDDLPGLTARGRDCSLRTDKIRQLGFRPRTVREGLEEMKGSKKGEGE